MPFEFQLEMRFVNNILAGNARTLSNTYTNEQLFIDEEAIEQMEQTIGMLATIKKV